MVSCVASVRCPRLKVPVPINDHSQLIAELSAEYTCTRPRSTALQDQALRYMVDGGSHAARLMQPSPLRIASAHGAYVWDEDGRQILDFWQGHFANILGHNPPLVASVLAEAFASGFGLQTGFTDRLQIETAQLLCERTGAERVRFTTSGTLANMYTIMLRAPSPVVGWWLKSEAAGMAHSLGL